MSINPDVKKQEIEVSFPKKQVSVALPDLIFNNAVVSSETSTKHLYKVFVRPHRDYSDIISDNPLNDSFVQKLESVQYNAALAITGCFRGTSRDKLYHELVLESLSDRR